jgi:hypothetical protein
MDIALLSPVGDGSLSACFDAYEVKRVARLSGPAAAAKQLGIARSSVYRMLGDAA